MFIYFVCVLNVCTCVLVLCHSVGSWSSLNSPNLISVESANIVSGRYAYMKDHLELDRFTDANNPPSWSVPPSLLCQTIWTKFIAANPDHGFQIGLTVAVFPFSYQHGIIHQHLRMRARCNVIREKLGV